jgi:hypothetical protein
MHSLAGDEEFLRALVRAALQEVLEAGDDGGLARREGRTERWDGRATGRAITAGMVVRIAGQHMYLWRAVDHEARSSRSWSSVVATGLRPSS